VILDKGTSIFELTEDEAPTPEIGGEDQAYDFSVEEDESKEPQAYKDIAALYELDTLQASEKSEEDLLAEYEEPVEEPQEEDAAAPYRSLAQEITDEVSTKSVAKIDLGKDVEETKEAAGKAAEDIKTVVSNPRSIILGGLLDSLQGSVNTLVDIGNLVDSQVGTDIIPDDFKVTAISELVPMRTGKHAEHMARSIIAFAAPFGALKKLATVGKMAKYSARVGTLGTDMIAGAMADVMSQDPDEKNLSAILQDVPELQNPVLAYLSSSDSRAEQRFKNALEGLVTGAAFDLAFKTFKFFKERSSFVEHVEKKGWFDADINSQTREFHEKVAKEELDVAIKEVNKKRSPKNLKRALEAHDKLENMGLKIQGKAFAPNVTQSQFIKTLKEIRLKANQVAKRIPEDTSPLGFAKTKGKGIKVNVEGEFAGDLAGNISNAKFNMKEDNRRVLSRVAKMSAGEIQQARRHIIDEPALRKLGDDLGMKIDDILNLEEGQTFNAEQMLASRNILAQSADNLVHVATLASRQEIPHLDFIDALDLHRAIQVKISGAIAETGRALQSLNYDVLGATGVERLRIINDLVKHQGEENLLNLSRHIAELDLKQINQLTTKSMTRKIYDAALEIRVNGLLSGGPTHLRNIVSNFSAMGSSIAETKWAEKFSKRGINFEGEAAAQWQGVVNGWGDALRLAHKSLKDGKYTGATKVDPTYNRKAISSDAFGLSDERVLGKAIDIVGSVVNAPGRALMASDEFFKALNYRMEAQRLWAVRSRSYVDLSPEQLARKQDEFFDSVDTKKAAQNFADYNTFTNTLPKDTLSQSLEKTARTVPLGRMLFPFVRTNLNIARYAVERTPGLARLLPEVQQAYIMGGKAQAKAQAKQQLGGAIMTAGLGLAYNGVLTGSGPGDPSAFKAWRDSGRQPYSLKVGNTYYAFDRFDPIGGILALGADMGQLASYATENEEVQYGEYASAITLAVGHLYTPDFLIENVGSIVDAAVRGDEKAFIGLAANLPATFIPYSSALRSVRRDIDINKRETMPVNETGIYTIFHGAINKMKNTIPYWSKTLSKALNRLGDDMVYPIGYTPEFLSVIATSQKKPGSAYEEIVKLGMASPLKASRGKGGSLRIRKLSNIVSIGGYKDIRLDTEQYLKYSKLAAGIGLKGREPLKKYLEKQISGGYKQAKGEWSIGRGEVLTDEMKRDWIKQTFNDYAMDARDQMEDDPVVFSKIKDFNKNRIEDFDIDKDFDIDIE